MFNSMHSDFDAVIKWANVSSRLCRHEFENLPLDKSHSSEPIVADVLNIVRHLATVSMLRSAVPACHDLAVVKHLKEVGGIRRVRSINGVLEPDLRTWVDGHVAGGD